MIHPGRNNPLDPEEKLLIAAVRLALADAGITGPGEPRHAKSARQLLEHLGLDSVARQVRGR